jgi:8-oxo-dGTP diphosphatase
VIPRGGREPGETEKECVHREVFEETGLRTEVGRLLLDEPPLDYDMYQRCKTYLSHITGGQPKPGVEPEMDNP